MKSVVVTGVSTGIGRGIAAVMVKRGWQVFGSVRKEADARTLRAELGEAFVPLVLDVEDDAAIVAASVVVRAHLGGRTLDGLVNNAGMALADPLLVQTVADFRRQIEVNLIGMFAVTRAFAPLLGAEPGLEGPKGRIVNISSVGGRIGPPFLGAYAASKHGVEGFSESLRRELQLVGIDVVIVGPGAVATPTWDKAEAAPSAHLAGTMWERPFRAFRDTMIENGRKGLTSDQIGEVVRTALTAAKPRARYAPVPGKLLNWTLPTTLPSRLVDRLIGGQLGLRHRPS
ncbi:SDR family NAD(P)-dependent oxidoreductase [uncultured Methylobacterium sp.]|uniref:SDR family NAD(P)-dependent oxidoreductase n=1 Tax=uncultured Methylobacterium sp. TaxID=157278 RepID=UPI0035CBFAA3